MENYLETIKIPWINLFKYFKIKNTWFCM